MFATLALALIAVGIAVAGWFRPAPSQISAVSASPMPTYSDQQVADAKAHVCAAYATVRQGVGINTGRSGGDDPTAILAVAANARLALYGGGGYLLTKLAQESATPLSLTDAIKILANTYQEIAIGYMADKQNSDLEENLRMADTASIDIKRLCK